MSHQDACEVCGRTLLVGEKVHSYVSAEGRHEICELCVDRVGERGWLPAGQDGAEERLRTDAERRPGLLGRLFGRAEREAGDVDRVPDLPHGEAAHLPAPDEVPEPEHSPVPAAPGPDADAHPAPLPDPAGRGMRPRRLQPDLSPASRFERAVARFNAGDAGRTTAGLARTLGTPSVSVGDLAGDGDVVRVTVAWELTWYQWGVDLGDELRPVFELERGFEMSEIDAAARQWNASAHEGRIAMVAPRSEAEDGHPVHR